MHPSFALRALVATSLVVSASCGGPVIDVSPLGVTEQGLMVGTIDGDPVCAGNLAEKLFPNALCVCGDFLTASKLETIGTHSGSGQGEGLAGIGVNGIFEPIGSSEVDGSVSTLGDWIPIGDHQVAGDLTVGGDVEVAGDIGVSGDARVAGDFTGIRANVGGTLTQPADSDLGWFIDVGDHDADAVEVSAPCPCDASDLLDVEGWVAEAEQDNDNDDIGLEDDSFEDVGTRGKQLSLPAGRYYLDELTARGPIELSLEGPTAIYVAGDLISSSIFRVDLETEDAELNLFVLGDIVATGQFQLGSSEAPGRVRTYVGGDGDIVLLGDLEIGGQLFAPQSTLIAAGPLDIYGSAMVGDMLEAGRISVHFDAAVLEASDSCQ